MLKVQLVRIGRHVTADDVQESIYPLPYRLDIEFALKGGRRGPATPQSTFSMQSFRPRCLLSRYTD